MPLAQKQITARTNTTDEDRATTPLSCPLLQCSTVCMLVLSWLHVHSVIMLCTIASSCQQLEIKHAGTRCSTTAINCTHDCHLR